MAFSYYVLVALSFHGKVVSIMVACKHFPERFPWKQVKACACVHVCVCVYVRRWEEKVLSSAWELFLGKLQV